MTLVTANADAIANNAELINKNEVEIAKAKEELKTVDSRIQTALADGDYATVTKLGTVAGELEDAIGAAESDLKTLKETQKANFDTLNGYINSNTTCLLYTSPSPRD